jgi:hypothetical protein
VSATDAGHRLVERAPSPLQERLTESFSALPEAEQESIVEVLERIVGLMGVSDVDAAAVLEAGPILQTDEGED